MQVYRGTWICYDARTPYSSLRKGTYDRCAVRPHVHPFQRSLPAIRWRRWASRPFRRRRRSAQAHRDALFRRQELRHPGVRGTGVPPRFGKDHNRERRRRAEGTRGNPLRGRWERASARALHGRRRPHARKTRRTVGAVRHRPHLARRLGGGGSGQTAPYDTYVPVGVDLRRIPGAHRSVDRFKNPPEPTQVIPSTIAFSSPLFSWRDRGRTLGETARALSATPRNGGYPHAGGSRPITGPADPNPPYPYCAGSALPPSATTVGPTARAIMSR